MNQLPYINTFVNEVFAREKQRWDFIYLRPLIVFSYFFQRTISFPLKFVFHRIPLGFEAYVIDWWMTFGLKYLATRDAAELLMRHVQIEPLLYRYILGPHEANPADTARRLNGIDGNFNVENVDVALRNRLTVGHDLLSYEVVDRFDRERFLENLKTIRATKPENHERLSKTILEENEKYSYQWLGPTNIVLLIVTTITFFGDLRTTITALNSFGSDSLLLWCMKHIYAGDETAQIDLDFFMQEVSNRGHYNNSAFFSNPSQYLYYHIVFDEVCYDTLMNPHRSAVRSRKLHGASHRVQYCHRRMYRIGSNFHQFKIALFRSHRPHNGVHRAVQRMIRGYPMPPMTKSRCVA